MILRAIGDTKRPFVLPYCRMHAQHRAGHCVVAAGHGGSWRGTGNHPFTDPFAVLSTFITLFRTKGSAPSYFTARCAIHKAEFKSILLVGIQPVCNQYVRYFQHPHSAGINSFGTDTMAAWTAFSNSTAFSG